MPVVSSTVTGLPTDGSTRAAAAAKHIIEFRTSRAPGEPPSHCIAYCLDSTKVQMKSCPVLCSQVLELGWGQHLKALCVMVQSSGKVFDWVDAPSSPPAQGQALPVRGGMHALGHSGRTARQRPGPEEGLQS